MSADNYYLVRRHPQGGFTPLMGFASDDRTPMVRDSDRSYPSAEEALKVVENEYSEYGASIHPECHRPVYHYSAASAREAFLSDNNEQLEPLETFVEDLLNRTENDYRFTFSDSELDHYLNGWGLFEKSGRIITNVDAEGNITLSDPYGDGNGNCLETLTIPVAVLDGTTNRLDWAKSLKN